MKVGETFLLENVTTPSGHVLNKGGQVRLVHIFHRNQLPDHDKIAEYYGYADRKSKAFAGAAMAFKEDRLVLERILPAGKTIVLLSRYACFLKGTGENRPKAERTEFSTPEQVLVDLSVGQTFLHPQIGRYQVVHIGNNGNGRNEVRLAYETKLRSGEIIWPEGHLIPINAFASHVVKSKTVRVS